MYQAKIFTVDDLDEMLQKLDSGDNRTITEIVLPILDEQLITFLKEDDERD